VHTYPLERWRRFTREPAGVDFLHLDCERPVTGVPVMRGGPCYRAARFMRRRPGHSARLLHERLRVRLRACLPFPDGCGDPGRRHRRRGDGQHANRSVSPRILKSVTRASPRS